MTRFLTVPEPLTVRTVFVCSGLMYVYALLWSVSPFLGWGEYGVDPCGTLCSIDWRRSSSAYLTAMFACCLGLPVAVMVVSYCKILHKMKDNAHENSGRLQQRTDHVTRVGNQCFFFHENLTEM